MKYSLMTERQTDSEAVVIRLRFTLWVRNNKNIIINYYTDIYLREYQSITSL